MCYSFLMLSDESYFLKGQVFPVGKLLHSEYNSSNGGTGVLVICIYLQLVVVLVIKTYN